MKLPIHTPRLVLRNFAAADWVALHAYNRGAEFIRFLPIEAPDAEATRGFVRLCMARAQELPRRHYDVVLAERGGALLLGTIRLSLRARGVADLGYAVRPECWNRGFATEAVGALLAAAVPSLRLAEIRATVDPDNAASGRVMEKLGFGLCRGEAGDPIKPGRPPSLLFRHRIAAAAKV